MAQTFDVEVSLIPKNEAGPDAKAPAVYLNDILLAEINGLRDGKISEQELIDELRKANIPERDAKSGCSCCCE